jgi:predicted acylesterase/phospholipase RssA
MNNLVTHTLALFGVTGAAVLAVLDELAVFQDVFIGAGAGAIIGKLVVGWRERGGHQLAEYRRRQLEVRWITLGAGFGLGLYLFVELL